MISRRTSLATWANRNGWTVGAELGLSLGETTFYLLRNCPRLFLHCVDTWLPGNDPRYDARRWDHQRRELVWMQRSRNWPGRYTLHRKDTVEAAADVSDGSLDFVFVDADHTEAGCRADIMAWLPKLKPDGWMTGHDIHMDGVKAAVDSVFTDYRTAPDYVWYVPTAGSSRSTILQGGHDA